MATGVFNFESKWFHPETENEIAHELKQLRMMSALRPLQEFLREHGLRTGISYDPIADKLVPDLMENEEKKYEFLRFSRRLRTFCKKSVCIVNLEKDGCNAFIDFVRDRTESDYTSLRRSKSSQEISEYPTLQSVEPTLDYLESFEQWILNIENIRPLRAQEELDPQDVEVDGRYRDYGARFYAELRADYHAIDSLVVAPEREMILMLLDSNVSRVSTDPSRLINKYFRYISEALSFLDEDYDRFEIVDLYPALHSLYYKEHVGKLTKISFTCGSRAVHSGNAGKHEDLRKEEYHEAGVDAVGDIDPFQLGMEWEDRSVVFRESQEARALYDGKYSDFAKGNSLEYFVADRWTGLSDIWWLVEKTIDHLD